MPQEMRGHFLEACQWAFAEIEFPENLAPRLFSTLYEKFEGGDAIRSTASSFRDILPDGAWYWPRYEKEIADVLDRESDARRSRIVNADFELIGSIVGYGDLRKIAQGILKEKVPAIKSMAQAQLVLSTLREKGQEAVALPMLRCAVIDQIKKDFRAKKTDPTTRLEMLLNRIWRKAYSLGQRERMLASAETFPYWRLSVSNKMLARKICAENDGKFYKWDDPIWGLLNSPCDELECHCSLHAANERMIERENSKIDTHAK